MSFKKADIAIRMKDGVAYRKGYIFEACFSDGSLYDMGVFKDEAKDALHVTHWVVTDLMTGLYVCEGRTRIDAVKNFQDRFCSKLERLIMSNEHYSSAPSCHENYYEHMTSVFEQICAEQARKVTNNEI